MGIYTLEKLAGCQAADLEELVCLDLGPHTSFFGDLLKAARDKDACIKVIEAARVLDNHARVGKHSLLYSNVAAPTMAQWLLSEAQKTKSDMEQLVMSPGGPAEAGAVMLRAKELSDVNLKVISRNYVLFARTLFSDDLVADLRVFAATCELLCEMHLALLDRASVTDALEDAISAAVTERFLRFHKEKYPKCPTVASEVLDRRFRASGRPAVRAAVGAALAARGPRRDLLRKIVKGIDVAASTASFLGSVQTEGKISSESLKHFENISGLAWGAFDPSRAAGAPRPLQPIADPVQSAAAPATKECAPVGEARQPDRDAARGEGPPQDPVAP